MNNSSGLTNELLSAALMARENAYAPYSGFRVGAAVLSVDGTIISGANMENVSSGLTVCAERVAVFSAIAAGHRLFAAIAIIGESRHPVFPCGACRQVLWELTGNIEVIVSNLKNDTVRIMLSELLPHPFTMEGVSSPKEYFRVNNKE